MEHTIKVLIADDHQMILDGLKSLLTQDDQIEVIGEAKTGEEVITKAKSALELDVLILDINMPGKDGIEVSKELKSSFPEIKILVLTMYNRPEFIKNLLEVGINGYILKNAGKKELIRAIKQLASGESYFGPEITKVIIDSYQKNRVFNNPLSIELTDREKEIIRLIAEGLSSQEIADSLFISTHTVNTHRKNILSKLDVKNVAGIIRFGIQAGIVRGFDL